jgi:hypothetical protein
MWQSITPGLGTGSSWHPATGADQPCRVPDPPETSLRRTHARVPDRRLTAPFRGEKKQVTDMIVYSSPAGSAAAIACSQSTSWPAVRVAGACVRCRMTQHSGCGSTPRSPGPGFGMCAADLGSRRKPAPPPWRRGSRYGTAQLVVAARPAGHDLRQPSMTAPGSTAGRRAGT